DTAQRPGLQPSPDDSVGPCTRCNLETRGHVAHAFPSGPDCRMSSTSEEANMTRTTNARVAGVTFLAYIALGVPAMILSGRATGAHGIAAQLAGIAQHASDVRIAAVLDLCCTFAAVVLAVTLYAITRDQDPDIAMLGLTCRVGEGVVGAVSIPRS